MVGCVCCVRCITLGFCIDISWFQANIYILYRQSMRQISPIYHIFKQEKWGKYRNISEISPLLALILLWLATLALNNVKFGWSSCADLQYRFIPPFMSILCRSRLHLGVPSKCGGNIEKWRQISPIYLYLFRLPWQANISEDIAISIQDPRSDVS